MGTMTLFAITICEPINASYLSEIMSLEHEISFFVAYLYSAKRMITLNKTIKATVGHSSFNE